MDPPIQTEYFLSGGAMILIFMVGGARAVISFCILSAIPGRKETLQNMTEKVSQVDQLKVTIANGCTLPLNDAI